MRRDETNTTSAAPQKQNQIPIPSPIELNNMSSESPHEQRERKRDAMRKSLVKVLEVARMTDAAKCLSLVMMIE